MTMLSSNKIEKSYSPIGCEMNDNSNKVLPNIHMPDKVLMTA